jgi:hypothetical protein
MSDEMTPRENKVDREEEAAAAEAGAIGGRAGDEDLDDAERPLAEGGEGVAEGFEQAEADLVENATHGDGEADPLDQAGEREASPDPAVHGEADEVDSTEDDAAEGEG